MLVMIELAWAMAGLEQFEKSDGNLSAQPMIAGDNHVLPYLGSKAQQHDAIFIEAVQLLDSMKSSPSCNRVAVTRLVTSCQFVGGKETGDSNTYEYETLDRIRSIYAARLAICELSGAGASVPSPCLPVAVSQPPTSNFRFPFTSKPRSSPDTSIDLLPEDLLRQCLKALESRPQWWTSYSNNRQNAMVICQAARIEVEREELLDLHRAIVKTSSKLHEGLGAALDNAALEASQHHAFLGEVRTMQESLTADLEKSAFITQNALARLLGEIWSGLDNVATSASSIMDNLRGEAGILAKELRDTSGSVRSLQDTLYQVQENTISRSQEVIRIHEEDALAYRDVASVLHHSLESIVDTDMARLFQRLMTFDSSLEWLNGRLVMIMEQENRMSQRLQTMETSMEQSYNRAHDLQQAQQSQAQLLAAQFKVQDEMQFKAQVSQALLEKVAISAANLHSMIDDATVKFKRTPGLHSGGISAWTVCALLLILIGGQSTRMAISLFFLILAPDAFAQVKKGLKNIFRRKKEKKAQQNSDAKPTETAATPAAVPEATPAQPAAPTEGTAPTPTPEATPAAPTEGTAPTPTPEATPAAPAESAPAETKPAVPTPAAGTDGAADPVTAAPKAEEPATAAAAAVPSQQATETPAKQEPAK
ncbi:hypothetical protein N7533_005477 [Penicillium manginii]|uniref:uncharacterized protein n=1 Tax=Penicillium manginii TaxID=203109 RepID=UPI002546AF12|nr:uncharacterized protein N7533_005477 [Penicillium manginii]KAJ5755934.1 hypothetical protein N7533_005477 [Penicillium manginii]